MSIDNFQLQVTAGFLHSFFLCLPLEIRSILNSTLSGLCTQLRMPIQRRQLWAHSTLTGEDQQISKTWSLWPWLQPWHLPPLPWWCHPHLLFLRLNQQVMTDVNINNIVPDSNLLDYFPQLLAVEPQYNEGPRDGQNLVAITRFRYIEDDCHIFYYYSGVKKIVRYIVDFVT